MARKPSETPTDWELFLIKVLWKGVSMTVDEVREELRIQGIKRSDSALRTILRNMKEKGLVKTEIDNRVTRFQAAIQRNPMEKKIFRHIIETLFDGNQSLFVARVLDESELDAETLRKMEKIIEQSNQRNGDTS